MNVFKRDFQDREQLMEELRGPRRHQCPMAQERIKLNIGEPHHSYADATHLFDQINQLPELLKNAEN